ncbi:hypothetical protein BKA61DRAFT_727553 [Leptodontidium sp. MPI-SDFR-AT-0119]|nr:hypothetical protein BKA61DRAFT_727553 [Leptodontidium sp. MPI-SDFR-AT-0119]
MPSTSTRLPFAAQLFPGSRRSLVTASVVQSSNITRAPNLRWTKIEGPVHETLIRELQKMYWGGVKRELLHILLTLRKWQQMEFAGTTLVDEKMTLFKALILLSIMVRRWRKAEQVPWKQALADMGKDMDADWKSSNIKMEIRVNLADRKSYSIIERRARMLLQNADHFDAQSASIQFVDACSRGAKKSSRSRKQEMKKLKLSMSTSLLSVKPATETIITAIRFSSSPTNTAFYKSIHKEESQSICRCSTVPKIDQDGSFRDLFPVHADEKHRGSGVTPGIKCGLLNPGTLVAESKYQCMLSKHEKQVSLDDQRRLNEIEKQKRLDKEEMIGKLKITGMKTVNQKSLVDEKQRVAEGGQSTVLEEEEADEDVPFFMRKFTNRYPFGNVHVALRVGPLIIESGVEHVRGALIMSRDPSNLQVLRDSDKDIEYSLALNGDTERSLHSQYRTDRKPKRYKAIMKQVVGGTFSGLSNTSLEDSIVTALLRESRRNFDLSPSDEERMLQRSVDRIHVLVTQLVGPRIEVYLQSVASKLLDPATNLHWNFHSNNCQNFCDSLSLTKIFLAAL